LYTIHGADRLPTYIARNKWSIYFFYLYRVRVGS